jgi:N-acetylglucosaminyldiphosphoundecaprenol N-acetyl-beta-D-mannosaminyltransferase
VDKKMTEQQATTAIDHITLRGIRLHALTESRCVEHLMDELDAGRGGWVVTPNLDHMRRAGSDSEFRGMLDEADVVVADGMPLIWASCLQGTPLPQRVAGSSLVWSLASAAADRGRSLYLLGGDPGAADNAARVLKSRYPDLRIAGSDCPEMGFDKDPERIEEVLKKVLAAGPDIVYVALGSPKQERLIRQVRARLPHVWWLGVGISLSFIAGDVRRAPRWIQKLGLEWLHRLVQEPGRLAKRYLVHGLPFAARLLTGAALSRLKRKRDARRHLTTL